MNSRERVKKTLEFSCPDRPARDLWALPGISMFRKHELDEILKKYPTDFVSPEFEYGKSELAKGTPYVKGTYIDEWGCEWFVAEDGIIGEVKNPRIKEISEINHFKTPYEILKNADFTKVNESCGKTEKFVLTGTTITIRPFERMQFLLGSEKLYVELGYGTKEIYKLKDILHEFFMKELELWIKTDVDGISFMDDWGSQNSLLISPDMWREIFKPMYKDYCDLIHSRGKYVFFHSDGNIESILPELIEIGIDALNSQLFCMNIEETGKKYRGKITFWGEIDRQHLLPFGTKEEIRKSVERIKNTLYLKEGGIIAQCEFGIKDPVENIMTVFESWDKQLH